MFADIRIPTSEACIQGKACGTPEYAAPEVITNGMYSTKCDIFSLGVLMYVMLFGTFPFSIKSSLLLHQFRDAQTDVRNFDCIEKTIHSGRISSGAQDLLLNMLQLVPKNRFSNQVNYLIMKNP